MKGMTIDEAKQAFTQKWGTASDAVREKYASRARAGATKSEIAEAKEANAPAKVAPIMATPATTPAPTAKLDFADLTKAPIAPGGEWQSVGNGATAANGYTAQPRMTAWEAKVAEQRQENEKTFTPEQMAAVARNQVNPSASSPDSSPVGRAVDTAVGVVGRGVSGVANSVASMVRGDVSQAAVDKKRSADYLSEDMARAEAASGRQAAINKINGANPAVVAPAAPLSPVAPVITPAPSVVAPPSPTMANQVGPSRSMMPTSAITGQKVMAGEVPKGVSALTGLPKGYMPGDDVSGMSPQIQQRAGESIRRQEQATAAAPMVAPSRPQGPMIPSTSTANAPRVNQPGIVERSNASAANYQASFGSDAGNAAAKDAQDKIYSGASELDKARLVANTLKRNAVVPTRR
jgi:hypothetical protein